MGEGGVEKIDGCMIRERGRAQKEARVAGGS